MIFSRLVSRQLLPCWFLGFTLILVLSSCTPLSGLKNSSVKTPTPLPPPGTPYADLKGVRPFIDTWNNIHLFQSFDNKIFDPTNAAKYYDFIWGAAVNHVQAIRSGNPNIFISYYIPFNRDNGAFTNPNAIHDLSYWKVVHPDWILYKCDRVTPAYEFGDPNIPLDFSNPALVSWQVQTYAVLASEAGYDGIAADNVSLQNYFGACGIYVNGQWKQLFTGQPDDPKYRADVLAWLARMQLALHRLPHPLALIPNLSLGNIPPTDPFVQQVVNHVDGILYEDGFTDDARDYVTGNKWVQLVQFMESVQQQRKPFYVVDQFNTPSVDRAEIQWALASYLMGKDHLAAIFISTYQGYGGDTRYFEYTAQVGSPVGVMYQSQNVYWRKYTNSVGIVNPSATQTYIVALNGSYVDLYGFPAGQKITLPPHSGIVLLISR